MGFLTRFFKRIPRDLFLHPLEAIALEPNSYVGIGDEKLILQAGQRITPLPFDFGYRKAYGTVNFDALRFSSTLMYDGQTSRIYNAEGPDKSQYVFKTFRPLEACEDGRNQGMDPETVSDVLGTVIAHFGLLSKPPFVPVRWVPMSLKAGSTIGYLMDYFPGVDIEKYLGNRNPMSEPEAVGRALLTYTDMLRLLHSKGNMFGDNKPSVILMNKDCAVIGDYDFVSNIEIMGEMDCPFRNYYTLAYTSPLHLLSVLRDNVCHMESTREKKGFRGQLESFGRQEVAEYYDLKLTEEEIDYLCNLKTHPVSDVIEFGLVLDRILCGDPWLVGISHQTMLKKALRENYSYPTERANRLPQNLRQVIPGLVSCPSNNSVTLEDIRQAIQRDFKV
jgi:serine/threonine protein kinase